MEKWLLGIAMGLLVGCGSTSVLVGGEYPAPLTDELPLDALLVLDEAFLAHVHSDTEVNKLTMTIGEAQAQLFTRIFTGMFNRLSVTEENTSQTGSDVLIIAPHVEDIQVGLPNNTRLEVYEVWIKYNLQVFEGDGTPIADWVMTCYGKTVDRTLGSKEAALSQAAEVALRDAGAQLVTKFRQASGVREWLQERLHDEYQEPVSL
ncbi:MAG: hypothetical protein ACWA5K_07375 [bacterium]